MNFKKIASAFLVMASLSSCVPGPKASGGTAIGALSGLAVGSMFGKGQGQVAGMLIGALAGGFIGNQIGSSLDEQDRQRMAANAQDSLENGKDNQISVWRNPNNNNSGTITPIRTYKENSGRYCREYTQTINIGGKVQEAYGTACRQEDGAWQVVSSN